MSPRRPASYRCILAGAGVWVAAMTGVSALAQGSPAIDAIRAAAGRERETRERLPEPPSAPPPPPREWQLELLVKTQDPEFASRGEAGFEASVRSALAPGDRAQAAHTRSLQYDRDREASDYSSASYERKLGEWSAKTGGDFGYYALNFPSGTGGISTYTGSYRSLYGTLGRRLGGGDAARWDVATTLTWKDAEAEFNDSPVFSAERKLALTTLELGYSGKGGNSSWWTRGFVRRGQPWFGAIEDRPGAPAAAPRLEAWTLRVEGGYYRWFSVRGRWITISTQGRLQAAEEPLYGSERLSVGGRDAVRGYSAYGGDAGYFLQQSVRHTWKAGARDAWEWTLSLALEAGDAWNVSPGGSALDRPLFGATAGLGLKHGDWRLLLEASEPIDNGVRKLDSETFVRAEARWRL